MIEIIRDHIVKAPKRSPRWPKAKRIKKRAVVQEHGALICEACGRKKWIIYIHHIFPFHIWPGRELDQNNLIALCAWCHLTLGHLRNWRSWNEKVKEQASLLLKQIKERPF